jgi:hypothetical protein
VASRLDHIIGTAEIGSAFQEFLEPSTEAGD